MSVSKKKTPKRKSLYGNGEFFRNMCRVHTVGELKELLAMLPDELPLDPGHSENLTLDDSDAWDEEDDLEERKTG